MTVSPGFIANFDSASAMLRGLGRALSGREFLNLGVAPRQVEPLFRMLNYMPQSVRETLYIWSGWFEAIQTWRLGSVRAERLSKWVASEYPRKEYPAVAIGSSNGALVHLFAAMQIPWLPQTFLIPVRRHGIHPDEPQQDMEWGREHAGPLLKANPELKLHHMNDANQDRLMIQRMTYFRVKRLRLGAAYEQFLNERLPAGGTIYIVDCRLKWPTVSIGDRHVFQHGALGGATIDEFRHGGRRVEEYLERYQSHRRRWESPEPDSLSPEAEWGYEEALTEDIERIARRNGYRIRRIVFDEPEHVSPLVADLYRWWYRQRRMISNRLLVESFLLQEPHWTLRTGSTPYWMTFNKEPSARSLQEYLDHTDPFDEIWMMLFSHGVDSVGLMPIAEWRKILERAQKHGDFVGVNEPKFPRDFSVYARYNPDLKRQIRARYPLPGPLTTGRLERFLAESGTRYRVQWWEGDRLQFGPESLDVGLPTVVARE